MRLTFVAGVVAVATLALATSPLGARPAHAGSGIFVPPVRLDLGALTGNDEQDEPVAGTQLLLGLHWATIYPKPTPVDIGFGLVTASLPMDDPDVAARTSNPEAGDDGATLSIVGGYIELSSRLAEGGFWRSWASARGEMFSAALRGERDTGLGAAMRISTELYYGVSGSGNDSAALGTAAIGLYVETSVRELPGDIAGVAFSAGLTMRVPLIIAD